VPVALVRLATASRPAGSGEGEGGQEPGYSDRRARRAAFDAITGGSLVDEPGGDW
jgi:hypothetical protein